MLRIEAAAGFATRVIGPGWDLVRSSESAINEEESRDPFAEWKNFELGLRVRERTVIVAGEQFHQIVLTPLVPAYGLRLSDIVRVARLFGGVDRYHYLPIAPRQESPPDTEAHLWILLRPDPLDPASASVRGWAAMPRFQKELAERPMP